MKRRGLSCQELIGFLGDYCEGTLAPGIRRRFEAHLNVCPDCVNYLESYRQSGTLQELACSPDAPLPDGVPPELIAAILDARRTD